MCGEILMQRIKTTLAMKQKGKSVADLYYRRSGAILMLLSCVMFLILYLVSERENDIDPLQYLSYKAYNANASENQFFFYSSFYDYFFFFLIIN